MFLSVSEQEVRAFYEYQYAEIKCDLNTYSWTLNGEFLQENKSYRSVHVKEGTLIFNTARVENSGIYSCLGKYSNGSNFNRTHFVYVGSKYLVHYRAIAKGK